MTRDRKISLTRRKYLQATSASVVGTASLQMAETVRAAGGEQQWAFETGGGIGTDPTVVDGTVFVGSKDYNLYAVDAVTGQQEWVFETGNYVSPAQTVVGGSVYLGSYDGNLYAVDAATGEQEWAFEMEGEVAASPIVVDGTVFAGGESYNFYAVDSATGEQEWAFEMEDSVYSTATVIDETIFVGSEDNNLYAMDAATGEQEWAFEMGDRVRSSPTVVGGSVYVGSFDNNLYAVDVATGQQEWTFQTDDFVVSSPTVVEGTVFVGSKDSNLYAVDVATGEQEWAFETGDYVYSSPTVVDGIVYVGSNDNNLYAVDAATGEQEWAFETGDSVTSSPTVVDGTVFVGSLDNNLYAVDGSVSGSSEGSRVMLGTLGHHGQSHPGQPYRSELVEASDYQTDSPAETPVSNETTTQTSAEPRSTTTTHQRTTTDAATADDDSIPWLPLGTGGALAGIGSLAAWRRFNGDDDNATTSDSTTGRESSPSAPAGTRQPGEMETDTPTTPTPTKSSDSKSESEKSPAVTDRIDDQLDTATEHVTTAKQARQAQEYPRALTACESASEVVERAHDLATENAPERVSEIETKRDRIDDLEREITAERDTYRTVTQSLESLSERLEEAAENFDTDPEAQLAKLDEIESRLEDVAGQASDYDFTAVNEEINRLQRRCDDLREEVDNAQTVRLAADTIPSIPRQSLAYKDIEKGEPIGSGGNADVYHATADTDAGTIELAVKQPRMSGTLHTETIERMLEEAETWQQLDDHDHIVSVVDYGSEPLPWIAMEYMDAGHIGDRAEDMDIDQKLWTAITTTEAVRHAHRRGVAHLDLKPENILFRSVANAWDVPKVADWGLSKHLLKHSKSVEGMSPHYAAPEQFDKEFGSADDITDVYQLGAVFYELFTGRPPFEGRPTQVMRSIMDEEPIPPSEVVDVPSPLDDILLTALAKEKNDRYESVLYLRDDLQELFDPK